MATVTGFTAARMLLMENASIQSGSIDSNGHLILVTKDGTLIDAGSALAAIPYASDSEVIAGTLLNKVLSPANLRALTPSTARQGLIELADAAEVIAGTDAVRAVTPATLASVVGIGTGYRYAQTVPFYSSGNFVKANYPGLRAIRVQLVGGGGAGGGAFAGGSGHSAGGGGGGGGYAEIFLVAVQIPTTVAVTIGAGGLGVSAASGGDGGISSFGSILSATGGLGGGTFAANTLTIGALSGAGGEGTGGDLYLPGSPGQMGGGAATLALGGNGGDSMMGAGGQGSYTGAGSGSSDGVDGRRFGGGGAGARSNSGGAAAKGGGGWGGFVKVEVYR